MQVSWRVRALFFSVSSFLFLGNPILADVELRKGTLAHFASAQEGAEMLGRADDYTSRMSEFDRSSRMKTGKPVSPEEFLKFVRQNVLAWTDSERATVEAAIAKVRPAVEAFPLTLPKRISFIKTTGSEEGKAFYTRGTAIVFPEAELKLRKAAALEKVIAHETFHILSRQNPALREALYNAIGFQKCAEVELPSELRSRKITNPDAPRNDHSIRLRLDGEEVVAVPVLYSKSEKYDVVRGGEFFEYLRFEFLVRRKGDAGFTKLVPPAGVSGFFEQVGRNTNYVIHPEEILAENFASLVFGEAKVASPEILQRMRSLLMRQ